MSRLLDPRLWALIAVIASVIGLGYWGYTTIYNNGADSVQVKWDAEKKDRAEAQLAAIELINADSRNLQAQAEARERAKNAKIASLDTALKSAIASLSNRPSRPADSGSDVPSPAASGESAPSCTGARLYRDDSELLTRLAKDATELREGLATCYEAYDAAKKAIDLVNSRRTAK